MGYSWGEEAVVVESYSSLLNQSDNFLLIFLFMLEKVSFPFYVNASLGSNLNSSSCICELEFNANSGQSSTV